MYTLYICTEEEVGKEIWEDIIENKLYELIGSIRINIIYLLRKRVMDYNIYKTFNFGPILKFLIIYIG